MAQNVGTPRFYIDYLQYWDSLGLLYLKGATESDEPSTNHPEWIGLNPSNTASFTSNTGGAYRDWLRFEATIQDSLAIPDNMWAGAFGHNFKSADKGFGHRENTEVGNEGHDNLVEIVNDGGNPDDTSKVPLDGFTMRTFKPRLNLISGPHFKVQGESPSGQEITIGSLGYGGYYDMQAPDLNLKLSYEYDGVKNIQTKGGATLSSASYTKPADWGDRGAWQLGSGEGGQGISNIRSGRRVWDLSFSFLADTDIMPKVAATTNYEATNGDYEYSENPNENTLLDGTDFFSVVYNRVLANHLPFIFNPNGGGTSPNNNPDQFAICRFVGNSLQYEQVNSNLYNVKLKIRETW